MMDELAQRAVEVVREVLGDHGVWGTSEVSRDVVVALQEAGLIARCTCPVGFGQVRDEKCPAHGERQPAHTIVGVEPLELSEEEVQAEIAGDEKRGWLA